MILFLHAALFVVLPSFSPASVLSLLHTSYSSMLPCLLCCPLSAPHLSYLSYTHLIPPCCPVCCVVLFQPRICLISLTHILFLHAALFVVWSSFSPASVLSLLHTSYSSMLPCLLCCPLSAPHLSYLSYTHLIPPCCPVCCVVLFQPCICLISLTHILFLHAALFVVWSSFSPASVLSLLHTSYSSMLPCLLCGPLSALHLSYLSYTHLIPPCCPVCCVVLFQPRICLISLTHILFLHAPLFVVWSSFSPASVLSLLHTSYSSMLPCLLCCPLSAPHLSYLSYTHLIPPCCPVCCVVLFQPCICLISLTHILFLHAALFVVLSSFSPASVLSLLHTSYSSMLPCLLCGPLSALHLSYLSYTHLIPPCSPVCCVVLFQPCICLISLTHILFLHAALFVVLSSFSPASVLSLLHTSYSSMLPCLLCGPLSALHLSYLSYTHLIPPCCPVCCVVLFQPRICLISLTHILFLHAALFVVWSSFSPASVLSLLHTSYSSMLPCLLCGPLSALHLSYLSYTHLIPPCCPVCCVVLFQPRICLISLTRILFLHAALFVVLSSFSPASVLSLLHTSYSSMLPCLLCCPLSAPHLSYLSYTRLSTSGLDALFFFSLECSHLAFFLLYAPLSSSIVLPFHNCIHFLSALLIAKVMLE